MREALKARRELAKEGDAGKGWEFVIADESGRTLMRVPLGLYRRGELPHQYRNRLSGPD
jgi:hypothetical protein